MSVYNKEDLIAHLNLLTPSGYTMDADGIYKKDEPARICTIGIGYDEYFPHSAVFGGIGVGICFKQVEQIYHTVAQQNNYHLNHTLTSRTFRKGFREDIIGEDTYYDIMLKTQVEDDVSFSQVRPYLEQMLQAGLNFLEQYQTLEQCYNYAESLEPLPRARFYQNPPPKELIIMKLLGIPYADRAAVILEGFTELNQSHEVAFIQALKQHLDNI